jgi:hypothetical protein
MDVWVDMTSATGVAAASSPAATTRAITSRSVNTPTSRIGIDDRDRADLMIGHRARGAQHRREWIDAHGLAVADNRLDGLHARPPATGRPNVPTMGCVRTAKSP